MTQRPFTESISATLDLLDDLADHHEEARAYQAARERMAYFHERLRQLQVSLSGLRAAAMLVGTALGDAAGADLWRRTCADLRDRAPAVFRSPGRAIVAANLDLLRLVEYTGAAIALVYERREHLVEQLVQHLQHLTTAGGMSEPDAEVLRAQLRLAIEQIAQRDGTQTPELLAEVWERLGGAREAGR